jgi:exopolysaccharide production protein ExoQ
MTVLASARFRFGMLTLALFTVLAGDVWRYSITWFGFGIIVLVVSIFSVMLLVRFRDRWRWGGLPYPLLAFIGLATVSIAWSYYPGASAVGVISTLLTALSAVAFAVAFSWSEIIRALGLALRIILGLSVLFELFVSLVLRRPLLPLWYDYGDGPHAKALYWSRDLLFDGGKIQGVVGNSTLLAFIALLALIVFGVQLSATPRHRLRIVLWLVLAAAVLYLTRSATVWVATAAVAVVFLAVVFLRRATTGRARSGRYAVVAAGLAALATVAVVARGPLLELLGKEPTLTGRSDIWQSVIELANQRPVFGWGWVSYWAPWVEPYNDLAFEGGVHQYQAHNAWLDVWLQLGVVGLLVFGLLVSSSLVRSWLFATERQITVRGSLGSFPPESMFPILVLTALLVQSLAESRLLIEYGLVLLIVIAVKTKRGDPPLRA